MHPDSWTVDNEHCGREIFLIPAGPLRVGIAAGREDTGSSPYGLLAWPTGTFPRIAGTMLFHPENGLAGTCLRLFADDRSWVPDETTEISWLSSDPADPVVLVTWAAGSYAVRETFRSAYEDGKVIGLLRTISVQLPPDTPSPRICLSVVPNPYLFDGLPRLFEDNGFATANGTGDLIIYALPSPDQQVSRFERFLLVDQESYTDGVAASFIYWCTTKEEPETDDPARPSSVPAKPHYSGDVPADTFPGRLLRALDLCRIGLRSVIDERGAFDASTFQYGYEWGQDAAVVATSLAYVGETDLARRVVDNLLTRLTNEQGRVVESSRFRDGPMAELNANGALLAAIADVVRISGDDAIVREHHNRILAIGNLIAERPEVAECGGISGRRDLWERLPWTGVEDGFDVATNSWAARGLAAGARLLSDQGRNEIAERWSDAAAILRQSFRRIFVDDGRLISRRLSNGEVADSMRATGAFDDERYRPYLPSSLPDDAPRAIEPDAVSALPIVHGLVDPSGPIAAATLAGLDRSLWNATGIGGYLRSPIASDPDSPGPWVFPTAWIAEAHLRAGNVDEARRATDWLLSVGGSSLAWYEYYGARSSPPYPPIGIIAWGWAQFILLVVRGWFGLEIDADAVRIDPRLPDFRYRLGIGSHHLTVDRSAMHKSSDKSHEIPIPLESDRTVRL